MTRRHKNKHGKTNNNQNNKRQVLRTWKRDSVVIDKHFSTLIKEFIKKVNDTNDEHKENTNRPSKEDMTGIFEHYQTKWLTFCTKSNTREGKVAIADPHAFVLFLAENGVPEDHIELISEQHA